MEEGIDPPPRASDGATSEPRQLESVESSSPELRGYIRNFDAYQVLSLVGGLLTVPELHPNCFRIEALGMAAIAYCRGSKTMSPNGLERALNQMLGQSGFALLEDPVQDAFVANVISSIGNTRIFQGAWETAGAWVQDLITALTVLARHESQARPTLSHVRGLLRISDAIAERLRIARNVLSDGTAHAIIRRPVPARWAQHLAAIRFSPKDLAELGVSEEQLSPFLLALPCDVARNQTSPLEQQPLVKQGDDYVFAQPTAASSAIRHFVLNDLLARGLLKRFQQELIDRQIALVEDHLTHMSARPATLDSPPPALEGRYELTERFARFDEDKLVHVVLLHDLLEECAREGLHSNQRLSDADQKTLQEHLLQRASSLLTTQCSSGLTLLVGCGVGRGTVLQLPQWPRGWSSSFLPLPDCGDLAWTRHGGLLSLWKLKGQEAWLIERGVTVLHISQDLNLFGYWQAQNWNLAPTALSIAKGSFIPVTPDFVASVRNSVRSGYDPHAIVRPRSNVWMPVLRREAHPFFKELADAPMFASPDALDMGYFLGAVETPSRAWWVSSRPGERSRAGFCYELWSAALHWLVRLAPLLDRRFGGLPAGPLEIEIQTSPDLDDALEFNKVPAEESPRARLDPKGFIILEVPTGFLRMLHRADNRGERALLASVVEGVSCLARSSIAADEVNDIVGQAVRNDDARMIHVFTARHAHEAVDSLPLPEARLIADPEQNTATPTLQPLPFLEAHERQRVVGRDRVVDVLHRIADALRERCRVRLSSLRREQVVARCLENSESIYRDDTLWKRTAAAVLGIFDNRDDVVGAANTRDSERTAASIASRIVAEMALCESPFGSGRTISDSDYDALTADAIVLVQVAHHADAVREGFSRPEIRFHPNGELVRDVTFLTEVVEPYRRNFFESAYEHAAASYERHFRTPAPAASADDVTKDLDPRFLTAFEAEFGVSFEPFVQVGDALAAFAMERRSCVVEARHTELVADICRRTPVQRDAVERLLARITLPHRQRWDDPKPAGFDKKDWYPWRFRRRLSLMSRPVADLGAPNDRRLVFGVSSLSKSLAYLFENFFRGHFPQVVAESKAMKSWLGTIADKLGHEFNDTCRDRLRTLGWQAESSVQMTQLGGDETLGDVDVFAWDSTTGRVLAIECKRLLQVRTVSEIVDQLARYRGDPADPEDELGKHVRRVERLRNNPAALKAKVRYAEPKIETVLVTNTVLPLSFIRGLPVNVSLPFSRVEELQK